MYGLILFASVFLCLLLIERNLNNQNRKFLWKCAFFMTIGAVMGARVYHVLDFWNIYAVNPLATIQIWRGGLGIFGALIGLILAFVIVGLSQRKKDKTFSFLAWGDIFAFYAPLAQSLGRFANYLNKELMPYAMYESIALFWLFCVFCVLKIFTKVSETRGFYAGAYLIGYGCIRILLEPFHGQNWVISGIYTAHIFSILFIITGIGIIIYGKNQRRAKNS